MPIGPWPTQMLRGPERGARVGYSQAALLATVGSSCKLLLNQSGITLVSNRVSSWADQSGNGFDVAMATANMRPDGTTTINGLVAPGFSNADATQDRLDGTQAISGIITASAWHAFIVFQTASHTVADGNFYDEELLIADSGGFWSAGSISTSGIHCGVWDGALKQTARTAITDAVPYLFESSLGSGTLTNRLANGTPVTAASGNVSTLTGTIRLGDRSSAGHLQGRIAFGMVCNAKLSVSAANYVRSYCASVYGVLV